MNDFGTVTGSVTTTKGPQHGFTAQVCASDVSSAVNVTEGPLVFVSKTGEYRQAITVKNTSSGAITGPLYILLNGLPDGVFPANGKGFSTCIASLVPYTTVNPAGGTLGAGASASVNVDFVNTSRAR
jgi:hypothetical protein